MRSIKFAIFILIFSTLPLIVHADCTDFAMALPGQTYALGDSGVTITFGQSQASGFCPVGDARLNYTECVEMNNKDYCTDQELPLRYQTVSGNPWLLIPDLAIGWLMNGKLYLVPINTPMMELEAVTGAGPIPWGSW